jgi:hypothetical protein
VVGVFGAQGRYRLSLWQLCLIVLFATATVTPLDFAGLYGQLGRDIWIAPLLQALVTGVSLVGVVVLVRRAGRRTLFELVQTSLGTWPARAYCLLLAVDFTALGPIRGVPLVSGLVRTALSPLMPSALIVVPLGLGVLYAAAMGPEVIARVGEVWAWVLVPVIALVAVVPWFLARWMYLWPPLETRPVAFTPDLLAYAVGPQGVALCLALCGYIRHAGGLPRPVFAGAAIGWAIGSLLYLQPTGLMPSTAVANLIDPELTAMDAVNAEPSAIESFVALAIPTWYAMSFVVMALDTWAASEMARQALGLADRRWPLAIVALVRVLPAWSPIASLAPSLIPELSFWELGAAVVAPLFLAALLRRVAKPLAPV